MPDKNGPVLTQKSESSKVGEFALHALIKDDMPFLELALDLIGTVQQPLRVEMVNQRGM